jgi:mannose-6-phosphate isomerase-like protein (cupin superfamily)
VAFSKKSRFGKEIILNPQEGVEVPPLVPHQMFNKTNVEVEFLVISQPTSKGDRVLINNFCSPN